MNGRDDDTELAKPLIVPLGDSALLVRAAEMLSETANRAALDIAARLGTAYLPGVREIVPSLVSVLLRYDPRQTSFATLAGWVRMALSTAEPGHPPLQATHDVAIAYGGADGPDLTDVCAQLGLPVADFVAAHQAGPLRVLTVGFAPGFIYCGLHPKALEVPRRAQVRDSVPVGSVLFAAGQTAIAATAVPTGWHVIGRTSLRNFRPDHAPPVTIAAGDWVRFSGEAPA